MKLSDQALTCIMMVLQKSLMEQSDIVPLLKGLEFKREVGDGELDELVVLNPPTQVTLGE